MGLNFIYGILRECETEKSKNPKENSKRKLSQNLFARKMVESLRNPPNIIFLILTIYVRVGICLIYDQIIMIGYPIDFAGPR